MYNLLYLHTNDDVCDFLLQKLDFRTNICLEEKLLKVVDKFEADKNMITRDLATQTQKVVEAKLTIQQLHKQNTQLKSDLQVALNILQMKPSSFISQKMDFCEGFSIFSLFFQATNV